MKHLEDLTALTKMYEVSSCKWIAHYTNIIGLPCSMHLSQHPSYLLVHFHYTFYNKSTINVMLLTMKYVNTQVVCVYVIFSICLADYDI